MDPQDVPIYYTLNLGDNSALSATTLREFKALMEPQLENGPVLEFGLKHVEGPYYIGCFIGPPASYFFRQQHIPSPRQAFEAAMGQMQKHIERWLRSSTLSTSS
jgi:hypothetical protein